MQERGGCEAERDGGGEGRRSSGSRPGGHGGGVTEQSPTSSRTQLQPEVCNQVSEDAATPSAVCVFMSPPQPGW